MMGLDNRGAMSAILDMQTSDFKKFKQGNPWSDEYWWLESVYNTVPKTWIY